MIQVIYGIVIVSRAIRLPTKISKKNKNKITRNKNEVLVVPNQNQECKQILFYVYQYTGCKVSDIDMDTSRSRWLRAYMKMNVSIVAEDV